MMPQRKFHRQIYKKLGKLGAFWAFLGVIGFGLLFLVSSFLFLFVYSYGIRYSLMLWLNHTSMISYQLVERVACG